MKPKKRVWLTLNGFPAVAVGMVLLWAVQAQLAPAQQEPKEKSGAPSSSAKASIARADPWAPIGAQDIGKQSAEEVEKKSRGCDSCHQGIEKMHVDEKIKLGCTDCHGGNAQFVAAKDLDPKSEPYLALKIKSHVLPKYPDEWPSSANPVRSYT
ncbi:MAG: hypothetical protein ACE5ER_06140, partial [Nitrospinaceae bacterium]